ELTGPGDTSAEAATFVVDSRAAAPGTLFFALPGEHVDGHDFVAGAFERGAVAAVVSHPLVEAAGPCLVVDDPIRALGALARHLVDEAVAGGLRVVAITGSQGKTSTKDLLAQILESAAPTVAPYGNHNNEIGVPLTAGRLAVDTRFLVVEMGARGVGHIAYLCEIAPPQVSVVLNVGQAHVGEFGSQQAIARAKGEIVEALPASGTAVLNADDPLVRSMASRTSAPVMLFSDRAEPTSEQAVWASDVRSDDLGRRRFSLHVRVAEGHRQAEVELQLSGRHHVTNAVAAAAAATAVGVPLDAIVAVLTAAQLRSRSRMEIHERSDDVVVINDAYNANPDSTRAALDTLAEIGGSRRTRTPGARTWALLGDMLELGETSLAEHTSLGRYVGELKIDRLVAVGEFASVLVREAVGAGIDPDHALALVDKTTLAAQVVPELRPGDTVLVKASRGLALDTVAEEIWTSPPSAPPPSGAPSDTAPESEDPA
ncbi:MAG: UDP-N-acetylmuramoyl-tripeptide--D-alanyl-D-alanine ligase, partial [Propionibacteriaceae bacterium]